MRRRAVGDGEPDAGNRALNKEFARPVVDVDGDQVVAGLEVAPMSSTTSSAPPSP